MKNFIKLLGLVTLICFSFFYTEKVITVVNEQDEIMIKINEEKDNYKISNIDAIIKEDTIIPGLYGKEVEVEKSYKNMRKIGIYNPELYIYNDIIPSISLKDNYDKYIIKGNNNKKEVALIFTIDNTSNLESILAKLNNNVTANFFIDYDYLNKNVNNLRKNLNNSFPYSYGKNGKYDPDILLISNNLIIRIFDNEANYCLTLEKNKEVLNTCSNNENYTIIPSIIGGYNEIKNNLENGSIIYIENTVKNINELNIIINFIKGKGLNIVSLNQLLKEKKD